MPRRTEREEKFLWAILEELDKEEARKVKKAAAKKANEVEKARKKLGAGRSQPSIKVAVQSIWGEDQCGTAQSREQPK